MKDEKRSIGVSLVSIAIIVTYIFVIASILEYDISPLSVIVIFLSVLFIALGIFIFKKKEEARKVFVALMAVVLEFGLLGVVFVLFWYTESKQQGMKTMDYITSQLLPILLTGCLAPLFFLIYFTRPKVKEQFK